MHSEVAAATAVDTIQTWIVARLAHELKMPADDIDIDEPLAHYGLGSLQAVSLAGALEQWLGRGLSPTLIYDYPDVRTLAEYLAEGATENADRAQFDIEELEGGWRG